MTRFTYDDITAANHDWLCSCGPAALCAILDVTLDEAKPFFMPAFPGYTTPTRMFEALRRNGRKWTWDSVMVNDKRPDWPAYGLARIQWEGPWTRPGANQRWAYTHTHWVGATSDPEKPRTLRIWDVNALGDGNDWRPLDGWLPMPGWVGLASLLTADIPRATGDWHITHAIEVQP